MKRTTTRLIIGTLFLLFTCSAALATDHWGLSFPTPGDKPTTNVPPETLLQYNAYCYSETDEKVIYLTFDAGYENGNTEPMLNALKKHNVPATFFLVGTYIRDNPDLIRRMVDEGHIVANHTMTHPNMASIASLDAFQKELAEPEAHYEAIIGSPMPKFYRPPNGKFSTKNLEMANELGYTTFFWSLAYVDWYDDNQPTKQQAFDKLIPRIHPGAIVLLHNTSRTNGEILDELLQTYLDLGYTFRSLSDFAEHSGL